MVNGECRAAGRDVSLVLLILYTNKYFMNKIFCFSILLLISTTLHGQSFGNIKELITLSQQEPLDIETSLTNSGFSYSGKTSQDRYEFEGYQESVQYAILPRVFQYNFVSRTTYLAFYSQLKKSGYSYQVGNVIILSTNTEKEATVFVKGGTQVSLVDMTEDDVESYAALIIPVDVGGSSGGYSDSKDNIAYGGFYAAVLFPRGVIANQPSQSTSIQQEFNGLGGIGAKTGFEFGISGVAGLNNLNEKLPYFLDFGVSLKAMYGLQPFSYESLGSPYDDFDYNNFIKLGGGGGPAIVLTPIRDADLRLFFYYDFLPSANFGGSIVYNGDEPNYEQEISRDVPSFALARAFGFTLKYEDIFIGIETSKYTDKSSYTNSYGYGAPLTQEKFNAKLPIQQLVLRIGYNFY